MAAPGGVQQGDLSDPNIIIKRYQAMQSECQALAAKLQELEMEASEHDLVGGQLKPLDPGRRAFRLVNGVLMERTVGEVIPELADTAVKLKMLVKQCGEQLERKQREMMEWKNKYQIRQQTTQEIQAQQQKMMAQQTGSGGGGGGGGASGVLA